MELYIATSAAAIALILYQNYKINDLRELYQNNLKQLRDIKTWIK